MKSFQNLLKLSKMSVEYNEEAKLKFHNLSTKVLKDLAEKLNLDSSTYDIRSNKGGYAVSGEITLHSEHLYLQISQFIGNTQVLYRSCNGRKDFAGGKNNFSPLDALMDEKMLSVLKRISCP